GMGGWVGGAVEGGGGAVVQGDAETALLPGDRVRLAGVARRPRGFWNEGAFDKEGFFAARGLDWQIAARPPGIVPTDEPPSWSPWPPPPVPRRRAAAGPTAPSIG